MKSLLIVLLPYGFLLGEIEKNEKSFSIKPLKTVFLSLNML